MKSTAARKLRQVPQGYLVMGVDSHKKKHTAVTITQDFTTLVKFRFDNSKEGFEMLLQLFRVEMAKTGYTTRSIYNQELISKDEEKIESA